MELETSINNLIQVLKEKPLMIFTGDTSYYSYKVYIEGFLSGLSASYGVNLILDITLWMRRKLKSDMDVFWTSYIPIYYKDKTEDELKLILIQTLSDYFDEHPGWYRDAQ